MKQFILVWMLFFTQSCLAESPTSTATPISHKIWDELLKKHVTTTGFVNYAGMKHDQADLKKYLTLLENNAPNDTWSKNEQLAYWINAYNAFTVQLILNHAAKNLKSIKDIGSVISIPFINSPWDIKFITIGGKKLDLNAIEHGIIRKKFNEPRIHFALVCAAKSCPPLRNEAFVAEKLDAQLHSQGVAFFNDASKNEITKNTIQLSKILDWYRGDFTGTIPEIVNKYAATKANKNALVTFKTYDWALNGKL